MKSSEAQVGKIKYGIKNREYAAEQTAVQSEMILHKIQALMSMLYSKWNY